MELIAHVRRIARRSRRRVKVSLPLAQGVRQQGFFRRAQASAATGLFPAMYVRFAGTFRPMSDSRCGLGPGNRRLDLGGDSSRATQSQGRLKRVELSLLPVAREGDERAGFPSPFGVNRPQQQVRCPSKLLGRSSGPLGGRPHRGAPVRL